MTDRSTSESRFESRLEARLVTRASIASRTFDAAEIARTAAIAGGSQRRLGRRFAWRGSPLSRPLVLLLVLVMLLLAAAVIAIGTGLLHQPPRLPDQLFTRTGDPIESRQGHTATLLQDGRVLIVGGGAPDGRVLASAELYDPRSGTFTATGSMATPREGQTALPLKDGRVVIIGGYSDNANPVPDVRTVEAYDPATGRFSDLGSLALGSPSSLPRIAAAETPDGRILVFAYGTALATSPYPGSAVFTFDPLDGLTATLATLPDCAMDTGDVVLLDGRVVVSCMDPSGTFSRHLFDPTTALLSSLELSASGDAAVRLLDGRIVFYGPGGTGPAHVLDPTTGLITAYDDISTLPGNPTTTVLADGRVLFLEESDAELMDPVTGAFLQLPPPPTPLSGQTATLLDDGRVLIVSETDEPIGPGTTPPPGAELFDAAALP